MYHPMIVTAFNILEKHTANIQSEINALVGTISEWADELLEAVEKELKADKESALFVLPKTPGEKKTRTRRGKNTLASNCSVANSTILPVERITLNETMSRRTRGAKRTQMSHLNVTKDVNETYSEVAKQKGLAVVTDSEEMSDLTFVMPKTSGRTKPVLKSKEPETAESDPVEPEMNKTQTLNTTKTGSGKVSPPKKVSQASGITSPERSRTKISKTPNGTPEEEDGGKTPVAINVINETPVERSSRRKKSRTLSGSPSERQSSRKLFRSLSGSPVIRSSRLVPTNPEESPIVRSSSPRSVGNTSGSPSEGRISRSRNNSKSNTSTSRDLKGGTPETLSLRGNRTVTINKEATPSAASTFVIANDSIDDGEKTPVVKEDMFFGTTKTSTPAPTAVAKLENLERQVVSAVTEDTEESITSTTEETSSQDATEVPKKKRKLKKAEEVKENIEETVAAADTVRITRTKSKAMKQMTEESEAKQADLSAFAKKLLNKAKITSVKKTQLAALLECNPSTPTNGPGLVNNLPFGNLTTSKSKYHLLLSSSKLKTPLATLPNSAVKIAKGSGDAKPKVASRDSSAENAVRTVMKTGKKDLEKETKLKAKKEKEEEAALKRQIVIKNKQEELKRKNELKHQMAMKQREKLEQEKYQNMKQTEKEKEERHKLILQERQTKLREEVLKKKMLTQQKIAETVERRRMEEEARIAKLKEMEAEEQRLALEKQKEQERQEKRERERLAQKKAREEYEMQVKQEMEAERLRAEKLSTAKKCMASASKMQSASKRQRFGLLGEKREWDYKPRNENDLGLEDEHSEVDSEDEKTYEKSKPAMTWAKKIMHGKSPSVKILTLEMLCEFMPCYQKTPDIYKMFKMTPTKRLKRTSSAIWNTPSS